MAVKSFKVLTTVSGFLGHFRKFRNECCGSIVQGVLHGLRLVPDRDGVPRDSKETRSGAESKNFCPSREKKREGCNADDTLHKGRAARTCVNKRGRMQGRRHAAHGGSAQRPVGDLRQEMRFTQTSSGMVTCSTRDGIRCAFGRNLAQERTTCT